jgi:hypothetical protein
MTLELFPSQSPDSLPDPSSAEALIATRLFLHQEVGRAALDVVAANANYHQLIMQTIKVNEALRQRNVDVDALISTLQPRSGAVGIE